MNTVWDSVESDAWCMDLNNEAYLKLFENEVCKSPISKKAYELFCAALDQRYIRELEGD